MRNRLTIALAVGSLAVLALAGCSGSGSGSGSSPAAAGSGSGSSASASAASGSGSSALTTASTKLGSVVVDGKGMTVYVYDEDAKGTKTSACTGACAGAWPAVTSTSATPSVDGVTGTVATIDAANGSHQVTLNGWPLYTYSGDSAAGDVAGQGLMGIWWAVDSTGAKVTGTGAGTDTGNTSGY